MNSFRYLDQVPGAGKTRYILILAENNLLEGKMTVIVCPSIAMQNQNAKSLEKYGDKVVVVNSKNAKRRVNNKDFDLADEFASRVNLKTPIILITHQLLEKINPDVLIDKNITLIIDEAPQDLIPIRQKLDGSWPKRKEGLIYTTTESGKRYAYLKPEFALNTNLILSGFLIQYSGYFHLLQNTEMNPLRVNIENRELVKPNIHFDFMFESDTLFSKSKMNSGMLVQQQHLGKPLKDIAKIYKNIGDPFLYGVPFTIQLLKYIKDKYHKDKTLVFLSATAKDMSYIAGHTVSHKASEDDDIYRSDEDLVSMQKSLDKLEFSEYKAKNLSKQNIVAPYKSKVEGLNKYRKFTTVVVASPVRYSNEQENLWKTIYLKPASESLSDMGKMYYEEDNYTYGLLHISNMIQQLMRGCARNGKDMRVLFMNKGDAISVQTIMDYYNFAEIHLAQKPKTNLTWWSGYKPNELRQSKTERFEVKQKIIAMNNGEAIDKMWNDRIVTYLVDNGLRKMDEHYRGAGVELNPQPNRKVVCRILQKVEAELKTEIESRAKSDLVEAKSDENHDDKDTPSMKDMDENVRKILGL